MTALAWGIHIAVIAAVSWVIRRRQRALRQFFWPALAIKLVSGVCLGLVYKYYYPVSDTFVYFSDASILTAFARSDFGSYLEVLALNNHLADLPLSLVEPRALFFTKITSVVNLLTADQYWITGLYFSFISFLGAWFLVQTITRYLPAVSAAAVIAFLFLPSVTFWTSGIIKESLAMGGMFFLTAVFLKIVFNEKLVWWEYLIASLSLFISWNLKYYYLAVFIPVVFTTLLYKFLVGKRFGMSPIRQLLTWSLIFIVPVIAVTFLHPNFQSSRILHVMVANNVAYNAFSNAGDVVRFDTLTATPLSILINAPWALFSGLFRPLFWEGNNIMQTMAGVENAFILVFSLAGAFRFKKFFTSSQRLLVLALLVYVVVLTVFITISAPNFGTLSRYRVGYLAFFVFIILCDNPLLQYLERSFSRLVSD